MATSDSHTPIIYELLAEANNSAADAALLSAVPRLSQRYRELALRTLIRRDRSRALAELVAAFNDYPPAVRTELLAHTAALEPALRLGIQHPDLRARTGALAWIVQSGDYELAYLLAEALAQQCPGTRERAAFGLQALAERCAVARGTLPHADKPAVSELEARHLAEALERGLRSWELHRRPEALRAAAWCIDLVEPALTALIDERRSTLPRALHALLLPPPDPKLAAFTLWALNVPAMRDAASRLIGRCEDAAFMTQLIAESWRMRADALRKVCIRIREQAWLAQSLDPLLANQGWRARAAVRFLGAAGLPQDAKITLLSRLAESPKAELARAALAQLIHLRTDTADLALRRIAGGLDPALAAIARSALARRRRPADRTQPHPAAPRPEEPAALVPSTAGSPPDQFNLLFASDGFKAASSPAVVKEILRALPDASHALRAKLSSSDPDQRARALHVARLGEWLEPLDTEVYRLAHDPEQVVRASAIATLGQLHTPTAMRILRNALQDPDPRVQANAVESLDQLEAERYESFIADKLESSNSRVRANAVKALLKWGVRRAADTLVEMLESSDRGERLSALWVVEQLHLGHLGENVQSLAQRDPDHAVRVSAERIGRSLQAGQVEHTAPGSSAPIRTPHGSGGPMGATPSTTKVEPAP